MKKLKFVFIVFFAFGFFNQMNAQTEMWVKQSPEIRMIIDKTPFEIRWRPVDVTFLPEKYVPLGYSARTDLMLGVNFRKFKLFSYSKFGFDGNIWTGLRLDYNVDLFDKKLLVNIQERYFWGLNDNSKDHYYLVQYIRYVFGDVTSAGILSYGKWKTGRDFNTGEWFIGPSLDFKLPNNFNFLFAYTKDIFHNQVYMTYLSLGYKFKVNKEKTI